MEYYTVTELKDRMKEIISRVEQGEDAVITRKGKPVARIEPFILKNENPNPLWKRSFKPVKIKSGNSTTQILRKIRDAERW